LPAIGNRLSVAAGVALAAGMLAGTAYGSSVAEGGTETTSGSYTIHTFTSSGLLKVKKAAGITFEYLVVAGGGSGGGCAGFNSYSPGGGGAGGMRTGTTSLSATDYNITVGAGGPAVSGNADGTNGADSIFATITATGGGGGGGGSSSTGRKGKDGGSGGGGNSQGNKAGGSGNTPSTSPSQGNNGGAGWDGGAYAGGGGGGAGDVGSNATSSAGGNGGPGVESSISGVSLFYAGGGGGASENANLGQGGSSIGGTGGGVNNNIAATDGAANTGSGGGGAGQDGVGHKGGSGIVIVRYVIPAAVPTITVTPGTLAFGTKFVNTTNTMTNTVAGDSLSDNITVTVTPYPEYQISTDNVTFVSSYTLTQTDGTVPLTTNYVRFSSAVAGSYPGAITNISGTATGIVTLTATATDPVPTLNVSPDSLNLGNVITNKTSTNFTYTLSGDILSADVTVTAPPYFLVATNPSVTFAQSCIVSVTQPTLGDTLIYVQFTPSNGSGPYGGSITNSTAGYTNSVALTGTGVVQTLYVSAGTLACGNLAVGASSTNSFTVSGTNLDDNVTVTSPSAEFTVSTNATGSFGSSCTVLVAGASAPSGATLSTLVYVKFTPQSMGSYSTNITCSSVGAVSQNKAVSGNGVVPTVYVSGTVAFGDVIVGTLSASQNYTVTGSNLTANVTVSAPTNCQVSTSSGSGFGSSLSLTTNAAGNLALTTVYVKFRPTALGAYSSSITNSSVGAANVLQAVTGNGTPLTPGLKATGGDSIYITNVLGTNFGVHIFTTVGTNYFTPNKAIADLEYLVVAGGGGGGYVHQGWCTGGGGAGGMTNGTASVNAGVPCAVTVGAGGLGSSDTGKAGGNSVFLTTTAYGGGGGGNDTFDNGGNGGSGGGAGGDLAGATNGLGTSGQGNDGYPRVSTTQGGGGGGAGAAATNANGGIGRLSTITGGSVRYAGGGGAGAETATPGNGGDGGGGKGNSGEGTDGYDGYPGEDGKGGGGGGGGRNSGEYPGGNGGSGIVIIRYEIPPPKGTVFLLR
jgi:hypothetical protein